MITKYFTKTTQILNNIKNKLTNEILGFRDSFSEIIQSTYYPQIAFVGSYNNSDAHTEASDATLFEHIWNMGVPKSKVNF